MRKWDLNHFRTEMIELPGHLLQIPLNRRHRIPVPAVSKRSLNVVLQVSLPRNMPENQLVISPLCNPLNNLTPWKNESAVFKRQSRTASRIFCDYLHQATKNPAVAGFLAFRDPRLRGALCFQGWGHGGNLGFPCSYPAPDGM